MKKKYPISSQFWPFDRFVPPITRGFLLRIVPLMKPPRFLFHDPAVEVRLEKVRSSDGAEIGCFVLSPKGAEAKAPCLLYLHGGGFVLEAAGYHYRNALRYAKECRCRVLFVQYRLAPQHPFPVFYEDCYAAMCWAWEQAERLGIDRNRMAVGGDSAGAALSAGLCLMARDRQHPVRFRFQLLLYPFLDMRGDSESCRRFTDTPMWNSELSNRIGPMTAVDRSDPSFVYYSPVEAPSVKDMPPTYIETAEFDCLHDDGILFAARLREAVIPAELNETRGTMHGFDMVQRAPITQNAIAKRIDYMRRMFA